jgi:hypothetical protein
MVIPVQSDDWTYTAVPPHAHAFSVLLDCDPDALSEGFEPRTSLERGAVISCPRGPYGRRVGRPCAL